MDEPSVMATENALMAAALTEGPTTIANAASEPHVQDLARLLVKMGAQIDGIGSNVMTVHGRDKLGGAEHRICPDHIEVASFMALAAATEGELRIRDTEPDDLIMIRRQFRRLGLQSMVEGDDVLVPPEQALEIRDDLGEAIPKIDDGPWPAFPADLTSIALALATQARGHDPDLREDVREPAVLRRQARRDGRSDHALRSPQGDRQRSEPSSRRARRQPRHPRRDGDAHRRALPRTAPRRSATSSRSTAATSASTSGCASSARGSSGSPWSRSRRRRHAANVRIASCSARRCRGASREPSTRSRTVMTHPIPPGTRDILPDEMRELRAAPACALVDAFERFGYGEVATPTIEYEEVLARGDERGAPAAYRFFDEAGELLAMRSDMTIPIARLVANRFAAAEPPFRLCYIATAYRAIRPQRGQMREFTQAGRRAGRRRRRPRAPPRSSRCSPRRSTPPG